MVVREINSGHIVLLMKPFHSYYVEPLFNFYLQLIKIFKPKQVRHKMVIIQSYSQGMEMFVMHAGVIEITVQILELAIA